MRKITILFIAVLLVAASFVGCSDDSVIEITDRAFINRTFDIMQNSDRYLGRTIQLEGIFWIFPTQGADRHFIIRYTLGCCGDDGMVGFELRMDDIAQLPAEDTWIEITGVLEAIEGAGPGRVQLHVVSLTEHEEWGTFFVQ